MMDFALTIEANSFLKATEILDDLTELGIIDEYSSGDDYLDTVVHSKSEHWAEYSTEPNIPDSNGSFDRKLIIGYRVSETPEANSINNISDELESLAELKQDIEENSKYTPEEIVLHVN